MLTIPEPVRKRAITSGVEDWLAQLPAIVREFEDEWQMRLGRVYEGGSEALVAEVTLEDGSAAVLKLLIPLESHSAETEITALRLAGGEGLARLLRADVERRAMLLERLGRPLATLGLTREQRRDVLCDTAALVWRPAAGCGLPTGADKGRWLIHFIESTWEELGRPCSEEAAACAVECAERRIAAHDDERAVLVHGDIHEWNTLEAAEGFKLIDPDGLLAEPEYDVGVIMREEEVLAGDPDPGLTARLLAGRTGLDAHAIWDWATVERLSTGLVCARMGYEPTATLLLRSAEAAARLEAPVRL